MPRRRLQKRKLRLVAIILMRQRCCLKHAILLGAPEGRFRDDARRDGLKGTAMLSDSGNNSV